MSPLLARLQTHGLLEAAETIARAHGAQVVELVVLPGPGRCELWNTMRAAGWSARNIERVFGLQRPAMPLEREEVTHAPRRPKPAAVVKMVGVPHETSARGARVLEPARASLTTTPGGRGAEEPPTLSGGARSAPVQGANADDLGPSSTPAPRAGGGSLGAPFSSPPTVDNVVQLFALRSGPGERRESCRRYPSCLDEYVRSTLTESRSGKGESHAHCPSGCRGFTPIPRDAEIDLALTGGETWLEKARRG